MLLAAADVGIWNGCFFEDAELQDVKNLAHFASCDQDAAPDIQCLLHKIEHMLTTNVYAKASDI